MDITKIGMSALTLELPCLSCPIVPGNHNQNISENSSFSLVRFTLMITVFLKQKFLRFFQIATDSAATTEQQSRPGK